MAKHLTILNALRHFAISCPAGNTAWITNFENDRLRI